jgi:hypothetical protein
VADIFGQEASIVLRILLRISKRQSELLFTPNVNHFSLLQIRFLPVSGDKENAFPSEAARRYSFVVSIFEVNNCGCVKFAVNTVTVRVCLVVASSVRSMVRPH